ncbi:hypothetical protein MCHUDSM44219_01535 [Mycolicibacterium chubuense]|uniref:Uncharacterized protein n=1 Tax=Mycolicibacterium chubuense TaxID=1800 RepID=A0A0J6WL04_MYCCU|nr:hypothetical protein MCHUDSM44219_01535 [Mycolicibacterium chubuense]SPY00551.1 Uncharacterised protein [Mycolicibacterium chubuense]
MIAVAGVCVVAGVFIGGRCRYGGALVIVWVCHDALSLSELTIYPQGVSVKHDFAPFDFRSLRMSM